MRLMCNVLLMSVIGVNDLVTVHDDVADFYRKFIGEKNKQDIGEVIVHLLLPPGGPKISKKERIYVSGAMALCMVK